MTISSLMIIGGSGDVGRGIVDAAAKRRWAVTVVGRDRARLDAIADDFGDVATLVGDISSSAGVAELAAQVDLATVGAVVVSVNARLVPGSLLATPWAEMAGHVHQQYEAHMSAAFGLIPGMSAGSRFVGIGGGMADVTYPGLGAASIAQAGLRAAYRHLRKEGRAHGVAVHQLVVHSMVAGRSNRSTADSSWLTAEEVGEAVCTMLADECPDPIVDLRPS